MSFRAEQDGERPFPLVIQVGFGGSRALRNAMTRDGTGLDRKLTDFLKARLARLREELGATDRHFCCGIAQIAVGADILFARACKEMGFPQRIFLPQAPEEYLNAASSSGAPDFTPAEQDEARTLLKSPHIIERRVVTVAESRGERFDEVNLEIVRVCDVLVCLRLANSPARRGGSGELVERARQRGKPVLDLTISLSGEDFSVSEAWENLSEFRLPAVPHELSSLTVPPAQTAIPSTSLCLERLKSFGSRHSRGRSRIFGVAAFVIVVSHVIATICAVAGVRLHESPLVEVFLATEALLLLLGFCVHLYLHHSKAAHVWAMSRLVAEVSRSLRAMSGIKIAPRFLFSLPMPSSLRPLLRTVNVLHLVSGRESTVDWRTLRTNYVQRRLIGADGQSSFYERKVNGSNIWLKLTRGMFMVFSVGAFAATCFELLHVFHVIPIERFEHLAPWAAPLAIVLPVLAVATVSLAACFDLEALIHTYSEMREYLAEQRSRIDGATSESEFGQAVLELEARLLGETAVWMSRRAYTGVA